MHSSIRKKIKTYLAKSSIKRVVIYQHSKNLCRISDKILDKIPKTIDNIVAVGGYESKKHFSKVLYKSLKWHDVGKIYKKWQDWIKAKYEKELNGTQIPENMKFSKVRHELYSAFYFLANAFCPTKDPDKVLKLFRKATEGKEDSREYQELWKMLLNLSQDDIATLISVLAHHGKFNHVTHAKWKTPESPWLDFALMDFLFEYFDHTSKENANDSFSLKQVMEYRIKTNSIRALVQVADRMASIEEENKELIDCIMNDQSWNYRYDFPFRGKVEGKRGTACHQRTPIQKKVFEVANRYDYILVRAKTAGGKSLCGLDFGNAKKHSEYHHVDHIIFAEPTRTTIEALHEAFDKKIKTKKGKPRKLFPSPELYHSSSRLFSKKNEIEKGHSEEMASKISEAKRMLLKGMFYPLKITTIDTLCIALAGAGEDSHSILMNLMNSVVIIDEIDFFDRFSMESIFVLIEILKEMGVPVMGMSATIPNIFVKRFEKMGFHIIEDEEGYDIEKFNLKVCDNNEDSPETFFTAFPEVLERIRNGEPAIIYKNVVGKLEMWMKYLKKHCGHIKLIVYHSQMKLEDRKNVQETLFEHLGKDVWENGKRPKGVVAILSQIGEISINISADIVITDSCPKDRLVQRLGRGGRFHSEMIDIYVIIPRKLTKGSYQFYPAPYGNITQNGWHPTEVMRISSMTLKSGIYSFRMLLNSVDEIYETVEKSGGFDKEIKRAKQNANILRDMFRKNSIICSPSIIDPERSEVGEYRVRLMFQKESVYVLGDVCTTVNDGKSGVRFYKDEDGRSILEFDNSSAKEEFDLYNIIAIPPYQIKKGSGSPNGEEPLFKIAIVRIKDRQEAQFFYIDNKENTPYHPQYGFFGI